MYSLRFNWLLSRKKPQIDYSLIYEKKNDIFNNKKTQLSVNNASMSSFCKVLEILLPACYFLNMTGMYYIHVICYPHIELIIFYTAIFRSELKFKYTYFGCQFFVALHLWHYFRINPCNLLCNTLTKCCNSWKIHADQNLPMVNSYTI